MPSRPRRRPFDVSTKDELIRIAADAGTDADLFLRCTRIGKAKSEDRYADESDFRVHVRCIGRNRIGKQVQTLRLIYERKRGHDGEVCLQSPDKSLCGCDFTERKVLYLEELQSRS